MWVAKPSDLVGRVPPATLQQYKAKFELLVMAQSNFGVAAKKGLEALKKHTELCQQLETELRDFALQLGVLIAD